MSKIYKRILYGLVLFEGLILASCESWLDVKPKAEIKSDVLFETENGFKDALIGAYLLMTDRDLYGMEMTVGFVDVIAQQYELGTSSNAYYQIAQYNYTSGSGVTKIENIWAKLYNAIANVNNILGQIDEKRGILHPTNYAIIKGECLGLRAYLHLDALRLFGYGDVERKPGNLRRLAIPYVTEYSKNISPQLTGEQVLEKVLNDLEQARKLLGIYDPWGTSPKEEDYVLPNDDKFYEDRHRRFNYFAVRATQARAYLWKGEYEKALPCVQEIIRYGQEAVKWNTAFDVTDPLYRDLTGTTEYIFGLYVTGLFEYVEPYIIEGKLNKNANLFYHTKTKADLLFETGAGLGADYRYRWLYDQSTTNFTLLKFKEIDGYKFANSMPLIRKPEVYYMAAECLNHTGTEEDRLQAISLLNTVRQYRNIGKLSDDLTQQEVTQEILKEYQKEFLCEGQMFYYYKRLGATDISGMAMDEQKYILPLPDVEIEFGGRQ